MSLRTIGVVGTVLLGIAVVLVAYDDRFGTKERMSDAHYQEILVKQLTMNRQTWATLQRHGVTEQTQLRLDFSYNAASLDAAEGLRAFIQQETDYDVHVESAGSFLRRKWRVEGTTQKTGASPAVLDQWVTWTVMAGKRCGCDFDGWGTSV